MSVDLPIGVFDSGVGGLTVMHAVADVLPHENLVYLGDTARVPYGNRGADTVRRYAINAATFLREREIKALVVACNTATAYALDALVAEFPDMPIIGVVQPVAKLAAATTRSQHVGVIGTRGTIASRCYDRTLESLSVKVTSTPCPLFVPLAEEGWLDGVVTQTVAQEYLKAFGTTDVDTLILGCTHYPLLAPAIGQAIQSICRHEVTLLDSGKATAAALVSVLKERKQLRASSTTGSRTFLATDDPISFSRTAERFFGGELDGVEHVDIVDVSDSRRTKT
ncbi:MAG: glutamate racemase [bacterium]